MRFHSRQVVSDHNVWIKHLRAVRNSLGAGVFVLALCLSACATQTSSRFDSALWKAQRGVSDDANRRSVMVEEAQALLRPGMTRGEVTQLLGEPDGSDKDHSADLYALGYHGFGIDQMSFEVFYQGGKLVRTKITQY